MLINTHKLPAEGIFSEIQGKTEKPVIENHSWHIAILTKGTELI
jgi:hypothetical protein